jgi:hypothetical protein
MEIMECNKDIEYPKTEKEWINLFKERNLYIEDGIDKMLEKMQTSTLPENQKFIKLAVEDLFGDTNNHKYEDICNKAKELGFELCEQDDGPKLRLSRPQEAGEWFRTGMKSIGVGEGLRIWNVRRRDVGREFLDWSDGKPDDEYRGISQFVFRLSKAA